MSLIPTPVIIFLHRIDTTRHDTTLILLAVEVPCSIFQRRHTTYVCDGTFLCKLRYSPGTITAITGEPEAAANLPAFFLFSTQQK